MIAHTLFTFYVEELDWIDYFLGGKNQIMWERKCSCTISDSQYSANCINFLLLNFKLNGKTLG